MPKKEKKQTEYYFGDTEENAFLEFVSTQDMIKREIIYNKYLKVPFEKMSESIFSTYKVHIGNYERDEVIKNGLSHLIQNMNKYDPNTVSKKTGKKVKVFSYCGTILRNYFKDHGKKSYTEKTTRSSYDDHSNEIEERDEFLYEIDKQTDVDNTGRFIDNFIETMKYRLENDKSLKKNEIIVGEAIVNVLENWDLLFLEETKHGKYVKRITNNYAKNKVLLMLKEQTLLSTKDIRISMKQFKELYGSSKIMFFNDLDEDE